MTASTPYAHGELASGSSTPLTMSMPSRYEEADCSNIGQTPDNPAGVTLRIAVRPMAGR
jgi:hypothetical protein